MKIDSRWKPRFDLVVQAPEDSIAQVWQLEFLTLRYYYDQTFLQGGGILNCLSRYKRTDNLTAL